MSTTTSSSKPSKWRWVWRIFGVLVGLFALVSIGLIADGWTSFGQAPDEARLERMTQSSQWNDGVFENPQPLWNDFAGSFSAMFQVSPVAVPKDPLPVVRSDGSLFKTAPESGLRITWLGHSTTLIEIDGHRVLTDPIWGDRSSPFDWAGPERWYAPLMPIEALPKLDAIVISHDHYDHLQRSTIERLKDIDTLFIVPLGVGAHLAYWGVPESKIKEVDWWDKTVVRDLEIVCTPARHASGRHLLDQNKTLWAGYALVGKKHRVFFSGDTGLFPGMKEIGTKLGPFDVTMIEIGAYHRAWPDWHIGPEQSVRAHEMLRGKVFMPIHWGLWNMAMHGWTEPAERVVLAAKAKNITLSLPKPGQSIEPAHLPPFERWWPDIPWETAEQHPINSTLVD